MRQVRLKSYEGSQIFVFQHGTLFFYIFARGNDKGVTQQFMQWGEHRPHSLLLRLLSHVGYGMGEDEIKAIADSYVDHAIRSIDHILDPSADLTHCEHNVVRTGKRAAKCAICDQSDKVYKVTPSTDGN